MIPNNRLFHPFKDVLLALSLPFFFLSLFSSGFPDAIRRQD